MSYRSLESSNLGRRNIAFGFPLAQHRLGRASRKDRRALMIPRRLCVARRMEDPVANQDCVQPYPFLGRVQPFVLKLFLADGTHVVDAAGRIRNGDILGSFICL